jgi:branched-chain amino acid transport system ATP-binding protein
MLRLPSSMREERRHRGEVEEILRLVDLVSTKNKLVADLPFGVQKVVGFARALVMNPRVLLLDEPSAGLTGEERADMARFIRDVRKRFDLAIIWIEHDMRMVAELADRVVALDYGRTLAVGSASAVLNHPDVIRAYLGTGIKFKRNVEQGDVAAA